MVHGLKPIYNKNSKILILGSLPSIKSINSQEYYNNPINHFWKIISYVFENEYINFKDYQEKKSFLYKHHIALWDVIKSANRIGSLDNNIKDEEYNNLYTFIKNNSIQNIFVNGKKAESSFKKYLKINNLDIKYQVLPSSSSANTKYTLEDKINIWKIIKK